MDRLEQATNEVSQQMLNAQSRARKKSLFTIFGAFLFLVVICKVVGGVLDETYVLYVLAAVAFGAFVFDMKRLTRRFKYEMQSTDELND